MTNSIEVIENNESLLINDTFEYNWESRNIRKPTYKVKDIEKARELYKSIIGTFAAKVLISVMTKQQGIATENQYNIIMVASV